MIKTTALISFIILAVLLTVRPVHAQNLSNGTAIGLHVIDKVKDGDIIASSIKGYKLSSSPYDSQVFGVVSLQPAVYFNDASAKDEIPVISSGEVLVRVSSQNGDIQNGDFITSSTTPGVGEKATDNGYVLGRAQQS